MSAVGSSSGMIILVDGRAKINFLESRTQNNQMKGVWG